MPWGKGQANMDIHLNKGEWIKLIDAHKMVLENSYRLNSFQAYYEVYEESILL